MGLVIRNATIVDGTGDVPFVGSISVEGDRIARVARRAVEPTNEPTDDETTDECIDGSGLVLAPGFVDVHTHDDLAVVASPNHGCKTLQGCTSVVVGNCGMSPAPAVDDDDAFGRSPFQRIADYLDEVAAQRPAVNVAALVGHGTIRQRVMGRQNPAEPTTEELAAMLDLLTVAFDDGAIGFSTGLAYEPGTYSSIDELRQFARVAADYGAIYTTHMRDEGDELLASIAESIEVAESAGVRLQISHLKAAGRGNWGKVAAALEAIDDARQRGVDVMADQYPYTRGSTLLEQVLQAGAFDGPSPFGMVTPAQVLIAAAPSQPEVEGRTLAALAAERDVDAISLAEQLVAADGRRCFVVLDMMSEADVCTVLAHPAVMIGTDGIPAGNKPHPRLNHTYPRILGRYTRQQAVVELPDIVRRMTSLPAERFGFVDRGVITPGAFADLVLFDAAAIIDTGTWTEPNLPPLGVHGVWVNGERVVEGQHVTGARPGVVIRAGS